MKPARWAAGKWNGLSAKSATVGYWSVNAEQLQPIEAAAVFRQLPKGYGTESSPAFAGAKNGSERPRMIIGPW
jgi:hypothetical protein